MAEELTPRAETRIIDTILSNFVQQEQHDWLQDQQCDGETTEDELKSFLFEVTYNALRVKYEKCDFSMSPEEEIRIEYLKERKSGYLPCLPI